MKSVTILYEAKLDLLDGVEYYESKSPGLGLDFEKEVKASIGQIRNSPERWPKKDDDTRRILLHSFPYSIVYIYYEDHVWIIAIAHHKRKPDYWKDNNK